MTNRLPEYGESPKCHYSFKVQECIDTPRANPAENEDASLVVGHGNGGVSALVLDGATGVGDIADSYGADMARRLGMPHVSGGLFASTVVRREISQLLSRSFRSPKELLLYGAASLRLSLEKLHVRPDHFTQVASTLGAVADIEPSGTLGWACIRADVSVLLLRSDGTEEWHPADHPLDFHEGKALAVALRNNPADISRSLVADQDVQAYINQVNRAGENADTYGSLNGAARDVIDPWIEEGRTRVNAGDRVYLFTDGFLPEKERRAYDSDEAFQEEQKRQRELVVTTLRESSAAKLLSLVRDRQKSDPACTLYPRFKAAGDDATLIEIEVR